MKLLKTASIVAILGGLVLGMRLAQVLTIEAAYDGPHHLLSTVPVFLIFAGIGANSIFRGVLFLRSPNGKNAVRVSRACAVSLWILLFSIRTDAFSALIISCVAYFCLLKPAVRKEFGIGKEPNPAPEATPGLRPS